MERAGEGAWTSSLVYCDVGAGKQFEAPVPAHTGWDSCWLMAIIDSSVLKIYFRDDRK